MPKATGEEFECEVDFASTDLGPLSWMMRPCEWYLQEYRDCKSIRGRVHQYFISGAVDSCDSWRDDYTNCQLFRKTQQREHLNKVIQSELDRKEKRFEESKLNDIWEYRSEPPADWSSPVDKKHPQQKQQS